MKKLNSSRVLDYFEHVGEVLRSTSEGEVACLSPREALVFAVHTGAQYVFDDGRTFAPKDLLRFFNRESSYEPIWGVCDGPNIVNSPRIWALDYPSLPTGEKYVLPVELTDEQEMVAAISRVRNSPRLANNTLILRIETWKKGGGAEPFLEYAASRTFRSHGLFVDSQVTISATEGTPDVVACDLPNQLQAIEQCRPDVQGGVALVELASLGFDSKPNQLGSETDLTEIAGLCRTGVVALEAKTGHASASNQIEKYRATGLFSEVLELRDIYKPADVLSGGVLHLSATSGGMSFSRNPARAVCPSSERRATFRRWIECQVLGHLLLNLEVMQLNDLYKHHVGESPESAANAVVHLMQSLPILDVLRAISQ